MHNVNNNQD